MIFCVNSVATHFSLSLGNLNTNNETDLLHYPISAFLLHYRLLITSSANFGVTLSGPI